MTTSNIFQIPPQLFSTQVRLHLLFFIVLVGSFLAALPAQEVWAQRISDSDISTDLTETKTAGSSLSSADRRTVRRGVEPESGRRYLEITTAVAEDSESSSNDTNVTIPDATSSGPGDWVSSEIGISSAPSSAEVTSIEVYFRCVHSYSGDLKVDLNADAQGDLGNVRLWDREGGASNNPEKTVDGITEYNGRSVNRTWYLYARDFAAGDQGYIDEWTIRVYYESAPSAPELESPGNSSSPGPELSGTEQTFQWESVSGAEKYGLYVRDLTTGNLVVDNESISSSATSHSETLTAGHEYRWNMRAYADGQWSDFSEEYYFEIEAPALSAPELVSPGSESSPGPTLSDTEQTFQWESVSGAEKYGLYVRNESTGELVVDDDNVNSTSQTETLTEGDKYKWEVRAYGNGQWSDFSEDYYFQIEEQAGPNLIVENVSFSPSSVAVGEDISVSFTIRNIGDEQAGETIARMRLSTDDQLTENDEPLSPKDVEIPSIEAHSSHEVDDLQRTVPESTPADEYYVGVFADAGFELDQPTEDDAGLSENRLSVTTSGDGESPTAHTFDYPVGPGGGLGEERADPDSWYVARGFLDQSEKGYHLGEDWNHEDGADSDCGKNVYSIAKGKVIYSNNKGKEWGYVVIVRHKLPNGQIVESLYGHLKSISEDVNKGAIIGSRDGIGLMGDDDGDGADDDNDYCHLHFELRRPSSSDWGNVGHAYVDDRDNASGWVDPSDFIDERLVQKITLDPGLNDMSFSNEPEASTIADVVNTSQATTATNKTSGSASGIFEYVFWLGEDGTIEYGRINEVDPKAKRGYFVFVEGDESVTINYSGNSVDPALSLHRTMNMAGPTEQTPFASNDHVYPSAFYIDENGNVKSANPQSEALRPGTAYFLAADEETIFSPADASSSTKASTAAVSDTTGQRARREKVEHLLDRVNAKLARLRSKPASAEALGTTSGLSKASPTCDTDEASVFAICFQVEQEIPDEDPYTVELVAGTDPDATSGWEDESDVVQVEFSTPGYPHAYIDEGYGLQKSVKPSGNAEKTWPLLVTSASTSPQYGDNTNPVQLSWSVAQLPDQKRAQLLDEDGNVLVEDMREHTQLSRTVSDPGTQWRLTIRLTEQVDNDAPTATDDSDQTTEGQSVTTDVVDNDTDPEGNLDESSVQVESGPSDGTATANGDGTVTYTPDGGFTGEDSYTYTVADAQGARSGEATVTIDVKAPSDLPPIAPEASSSQRPGSEFWVDIRVGSESNNVENLHQVGFDLDFVQQHLSHVDDEEGSFLGDVQYAANIDSDNGIVEIGATRTDDEGVSGSGVVARVQLAVGEDVADGTDLTFSLQNVQAEDPDNGPIDLDPQDLAVTVQSGLAVWPGDMDNDGEVDQFDIFPLGDHWGATGPSRAEGDQGCDWRATTAQPWTPEAATYADANGDGEVNQFDIFCLGDNWGKKPNDGAAATASAAGKGARSRSRTGRLVLKATEAERKAVWVTVRARQVKNLLGFGMELSYPSGDWKVQQVEPATWLDEDLLAQTHVEEEAGRVAVGISRKGTGRSGNGRLVRLKLRPSASAGGTAKAALLDKIQLIESAGRTAGGHPVDFRTEKAASLETPEQLALSGGQPNPMRSSATIEYTLPDDQQVRLTVFDMLGRRVATLVDQRQRAGQKTVSLDVSAEGLSSGTYLLRLTAGGEAKTSRITVVR